METMENQILTLIRTSRLSRIADELAALLRPNIRLQSHAVDESELELGASKLGGLPDLPLGLEWPEYKGRPFKLLAQIRLADVAPYDLAHELPPTGMLSFFLDSSPEAYPYVLGHQRRVIYSDDDLSQLRRRSAPVAEDFWPFNPRALTFSSQLMLPPSRFLEENRDEYLTDETTEVLEEDDPDLEAYEQLTKQIEALFEVSHPRHQLLGYSYPIQFFTFDSHWNRLLLQIDTESYDMQWGDMGLLYFLIREEALAARDFSRVEATSQCC